MNIPAKMTLSLSVLFLSGCYSEKKNSHQSSHKNVLQGDQKSSASQKSDGLEDSSNEKGTRENIIAAFEAYLLDIINKQDGWLGENEKKRFNVFRQGEIDVMDREFEKFRTEVLRICTDWEDKVSKGIDINIYLASLGLKIREIPEIELYGEEVLVRDIYEVSERILAEFHRLFLEQFEKYQEADFLKWQSDLRVWSEFESDTFIRDL